MKVRRFGVYISEPEYLNIGLDSIPLPLNNYNTSTKLNFTWSNLALLAVI